MKFRDNYIINARANDFAGTRAAFRVAYRMSQPNTIAVFANDLY
jgi:hypothetical protein